MAKQIFMCPSCNNSSTYQIVTQARRYIDGRSINFVHSILRCDTCEELTYKILRFEQIFRGNYTASELKNEEEFQYPFGYLYLEVDLPKGIKNFYTEAFNCFKIGALRGSASMCRATISAICDDKKVTGKDLKEKLDNLPLSQRLIQVAKNIKWIADKTLHNEVDWARAKWDKNTIEEMLNFIGRIIDDLYTQERKAKELNKLVSKAGQPKLPKNK